MIIISLIGDQPIPNLLPILDVKPAIAVLVYTDRTCGVTQRLERALPAGCQPVPCCVSAYDVPQISEALLALIREHAWPPDELLFNLTGGTKAMVLAAYLAAQHHRAPLLYLQSEGRQSRLYRYAFDEAGVPRLCEDRLLGDLMTIDAYLHAYVDNFQVTGFAHRGDPKGNAFEQTIYEALRPVVDEVVAGVKIMGALDLDLVVRCGNQVGIIEAKTGRNDIKAGIDSLSAASGRLGTFTKRLLASALLWDHTMSNSKDLARAYQVEVIELPSFGQGNCLSEEDTRTLQRTVCKVLGREINP